MGRTIVVGDIHGCYDELLDLLDKVRFSHDDRLVAVGDLTVKGPRSLDVVELFRGDSRFCSVMGNHDLALVRRWHGEAIELKKSQQAAFDQLSADGSCINYLASLPLALDLKDYVVVHAGLRPGIRLEEQSTEDLTELRTLGGNPRSRKGQPWYEAYDDHKVALFGHWPAPEPRIGQRAIGLDTGCVYGYFLTAYIIETLQFVNVKARAAYVGAPG